MIKTEILPIIMYSRFLLQLKHKAVDKTLEQCFLKEFKATCKTSGESELKQQQKNDLKYTIGQSPYLFDSPCLVRRLVAFVSFRL